LRRYDEAAGREVALGATARAAAAAAEAGTRAAAANTAGAYTRSL